MPIGNAGTRRVRAVLAATLLATLAACIMNVEYARPGEALVPRPGKTLVFTRISFVRDGREFFPWDPSASIGSLTDVLLGADIDRHLWLRRLDVTAASWELHPDKDGSLAIWLPPGDYALLGTEGESTQGVRPTVVALLRIPADAAIVYAGMLVFTQEVREGWHAGYVFGAGHVTTDAPGVVARKLEARYGALPGLPVTSAWCAGSAVRSGDYNPAFVSESRRLLDEGCAQPR